MGRPEKTVYPTGFQTKNVYNAFGYLKEVRRADSGRNDVYWQADRYDASGRIDGEFYGNGTVNDRIYSAATGRLLGAAVGRGIETGPPYSIQYLSYTHDQMGNVNTRHDAVTGREERFYSTTPGDGYDGLDRLKVHTVVGGGTVTVSYDAMGNITAKSDVGTYSYGANAGPHAVTGVSGGPLGPQSYTYDANGNMTGGGGRTITWTSFNQVETVVQGSFTSTFSFGANHERVKQVSHLGTTVYAGGVWERFTDGGGVQEKNYVMAPTGRVAVVSFGAGVPVQGQTRYFHTDGLGSITAVTDEAGRVVKRFAFDAWGKRLDPATGNTITGTTSAGYTRGFTDHEQLDDFGLIHMNGRVYDPVLGRFLSADPFVDGVTDSQGYNRYSYLGNNPLGGTDPSGYFSLKDVVKIGAVVAAGVLTAGAAIYGYGTFVVGGSFAGGFAGALSSVSLASGWGVGWAAAAGAGLGFGSSFAASLLNGASIGDAFKSGALGGVIGGASAGILGKIGAAKLGNFNRGLAHGVVQGGATEAMGGAFRHGFYAGFAVGLSENAILGFTEKNPELGIAVAAAVGGTASSIGGGKFANGAASAVFSYMFNALSARALSGDFQVTDLDDLKSRMGWERGEAIVFTGKRPLAGWRSMWLRSGATDAVNWEALHEQVFMIDEAGTLHNVGFFNGPGPLGGIFSGGAVQSDPKFSFTDYTFNSSAIFWRSTPVLYPDPQMQYLRLMQTRANWNWSIGQLKPTYTNKYNLPMRNCQDFSTSFRITAQKWK